MAKPLRSPVLFSDLSAERPPTTRELADQVRSDGREGLPNPVQLADHALYQEVTCRSALNRVVGMPFQLTLNPYRGCTHGCHYCFARRYHRQLEMGPGDDFSSVILVKTNIAEVLGRELSRPSWAGELIALGTATDPYQPAEGRYRLTRRLLEVLVTKPNPLGLLTKGPLVVRDLDLLRDLSMRTTCTVSLSIPTVHDVWHQLEPGTAPPRQRLRAVARLVDAGIDAGVLMAPVVPGITSHPSRLADTVKAIADSGARWVGAVVLHLDAGTRDHFMDFLGREFPDLVDGYGRLYAGKHASERYRARVQAVLGTLKARYGPASKRQDQRAMPDSAPPTHTDRQLPLLGRS